MRHLRQNRPSHDLKHDRDSRSRSAVLLGVSLDASEEEVKRRIDRRRKRCTQTHLRGLLTSTAAPSLTCAKHTNACCISRQLLVTIKTMTFMVLVCERDSRQQGVGRERRGTHVDTSSFSRVDSSGVEQANDRYDGVPQQEEKSAAQPCANKQRQR